jgi:C-terminal processing protease CtpA/Prc
MKLPAPKTFLALFLPFLAGCASVMPGKLPTESPPLATMEEPLPLFQTPADEASRQNLPAGSFTGFVTTEAITSLKAGAEPIGLEVLDVIENSPGQAAGIMEGDILLEANIEAAETIRLQWPSQLRKLELDTPPGTAVEFTLDRAGVVRSAEVTLVRRISPPPRIETERFREDRRVGVVVRTPTEVESAGADLPPGAGAVIVGLDLNSPWRSAGLQYEDIIRTVNGQTVDHPQVLLNAIRQGKAPLELEVIRKDEKQVVSAPLSRRQREMKRVSIPLIYHFERDSDHTERSLLLGLLKTESTPAAWNMRILWLIRFSGGDSDRLQEVPVP